MRMRMCVAGLMVLTLLLGCGGASQSVTPAKPPDLKGILERLAESGELDDVKESLSTQLEKLEETDPAKAKNLSADFEALRKAKTPAQLKEQAKKMAAKL